MEEAPEELLKQSRTYIISDIMADQKNALYLKRARRICASSTRQI